MDHEPAEGTTPMFIVYERTLPLAELKTAKGAPVVLVKDMVLEYWLEARDNSDFPKKDGNLTKSKSFKIKLREPELDKQKLDQQQKEDEKQRQKERQDLQRKLNEEKKEQEKKNRSEQPGDPKQHGDGRERSVHALRT